jgi:hypothetical protein
MVSGLTILISLCAFIIPELIVVGWKRFLHSVYEAKNGTINLLYHVFCMGLLILEFHESFLKTVILEGFASIAFIGIFALLAGVLLGKHREFLIYENRVYKSFKMFGHPWVIFPITMSVAFFMYVFTF